MRTLLLALIALFVTGELLSQSPRFFRDSVKYVTDIEETFMVDKETKYLVKTGPLTFEFKIGKDVSFAPQIIPLSFIADSLFAGGLNLGLEGRYYYKMRKLIDQGKQANNLSGDYVSITPYRGVVNRTLGIVQGIDSIPKITSNGFILAKGSQYRYKNREYFDFRVQLSYFDARIEDGSGSLRKGWTLSAPTLYGLAFGKKHKLKDNVDCAIMKCHLDRSSALKVYRNNIFYLSRFEDRDQSIALWNLSLSPKVAYERKVGESVFSWYGIANTQFRLSNLTNTFTWNSVSFIGEIGARYYAKMRKKIREGASGNNLTGFYFSASFESKHSTFNSNVYDYYKHSVNVGIGHQREILGKLFMDIRILGGPVVYSNYGSNVNWIADLGLGYLF